MGVLVDRWSIRHYAMTPLPEVPSVEVFGMQIPVSIISISSLAGFARAPGSIDMEDILMACNYPSITRLPPERLDRENTGDSP